MTTLRIARILQDSVTDGPGLRAVVFCQGCKHNCPGCHNPELQGDGGAEMTPGEVVKAIVKNPLTDGVTFSGGEPMDQAEALIPIASALRGKGYNLWLYTGYTWEALSAVQRELAGLTDVVIDGRFILEERTLELPWRGSRNQRLIDAQKSAGGVVLWEPSFPA